jgi:hypothetical protein
MIRMDPQELRERARSFRSIALDGDDLHLKAALLELAVDFDREAMEFEMQVPNMSALLPSKILQYAK